MGMNKKDNKASSPEAVEKLTERIQEKVDSGWTMPSGWLFKGLTLYFPKESEDDNMLPENPQPNQSLRLHLARNFARFASANVTSSLKDSSITHVIVGPDTSASEVSRTRKTLSSRKKLPHIVNVEWIEESWKEKTVLNEECKSPACLSAWQLSKHISNLASCIGFQPSRKS
jgi:DNA ligase-4